MDSSSSNAYVEPIGVRVDDQSVTLWRPAGVDQPLVRDLDLGEWLEMERPRDVRKLIDRHASSLGEVCATVAQTSGKGGRPSKTYYLTEAQALLVVAKSETERATALLQHIIAIYLTWRDLGAMAQPPDWRAQQEQRQREMSHTLELRRLDMEEQRLAFDRKQAQAAALSAALQHPLFGEVGDDIKRAHLVTSVELATGMSLPALRPSATHLLGWMSPTDIARQTGSTPMAVGLAISRLWGTKRVEEAGRSKAILNTARPVDGQPSKPVITWLYSPPAVEQIIAELSRKPAAPARGKAAA